FITKVNDHMKTFKVPGAAVGILHGEDTLTKGLGVTNVDHPLPVDPTTLFQIGSITKTFVGTLTMMMTEEGKIELDAPIRTYLPEFKVKDPEATEKATVRHLLTHTSGWVGDWFPPDLGQGADAVARYVETMSDTPQLTPLGKVLSYNNAGFNVAGRILEAVTGKVFSDLIKERLFEPLGMSHTYLLPWELMVHRFAAGHVAKDGAPRPAQPWSIGRASGPAGGIMTCVRDMLNYGRFQLGDGAYKGKRLLGAESLKTLHTQQVRFAPHNGVAHTLWVDDRRASRTLSHSGGTVGQISMLTLVPDHDFAMLVVTNSGTGSQITQKVTNLALESYLGLETPELAPVKMPDERLKELEGQYTATLTSAEVTVKKGELYISQRSLGGFPTRDTPPASPEPSPPVHYAFYAEDNIVGTEEPNMGNLGQVIRNRDGSVAWLRIGTRIHRPLRHGK
ncbi:MAG TPA: serine hydrolase domain-containing protein, partial [Candidatus Bathyarchaeia archaeon]